MDPSAPVNDYDRQLTAAEIAAKAHREFVGGLWDEIGALQFEFMKARGLAPHDRLLDVGCGALRGGVRFVHYLDAGNYYGLDVNASLIEAGRRELAEAGLADRRPHLLVSDSFEVSLFDTSFPYALAVSLFSHLDRSLIVACLRNVGPALAAGGRFYASYFEAPTSSYTQPLHHPSGVITYHDCDAYHHSFAEMQAMAEEANLEVERIGDWRHPRGQTMLAFGHSV